MNALVWLVSGARGAGNSGWTRKSRSCAELDAQAEAGPLMLMVRRANMGAFHSRGPGKSQRPAVAGSFQPGPGGVAGNDDARADIARHHAAGADHSAVADCDAGQ